MFFSVANSGLREPPRCHRWEPCGPRRQTSRHSDDNALPCHCLSWEHLSCPLRMSLSPQRLCGHPGGIYALGLPLGQWHHWRYCKIMSSFSFYPAIVQYFNLLVDLWVLKMFACSRSFSADQGCNVNLNLNFCVLNLCLSVSSFSTQELVSGCSACIMGTGFVMFYKWPTIIWISSSGRKSEFLVRNQL